MTPWIPDTSVQLHWGDFFVCEEDWSWSVEDLPDLDLWYVMEGVGWIRASGERESIGLGDCLLMRPGGSYQAGHDPRRPLRLIAIHFSLLDAKGRRLDPPDPQLPPLQRQMDAQTFFCDLLSRAVTCHQQGCRAWACAWLQAGWMEVVRQDAKTWPRGLEGDQARAIERICERIRAHPERSIRITDLARELHVSPEHFSRLFRRFLGLSPRAFITKTRIEAAQTLLLTSSHTIGRIADLVGYESAFHFSRQFKAKVGIAPSAFRRGDHRRPFRVAEEAARRASSAATGARAAGQGGEEASQG